MDADVEVLVEAVEKSFAMKFDSGELEDDSSFDDLCEAIRARLMRGPAERCFTSIAFWRLRRACVELFGLSKRSIAPWTATDLVLPTTRRRRAWLALSGASGFRLPGLEYSSGLGQAIFWGSLVPSAGLLITRGGGWWLVVAVVLCPMSATLLFTCLKHFADVLPPHCGTFGDLAKSVAALNYGMIAQELGPSRESELLQSVRYVVADLIGIDPHALIGENPTLTDLALANDGFRAQV